MAVGAVPYDTFSPDSAGGVPFDRPAWAVPMYESAPIDGGVPAQEWGIPYREEIARGKCNARKGDGSACTAPPLKSGATEYCAGHARSVGLSLASALSKNAHAWGFRYDRG